jgi:hypothetical protein
MLAIDNAMVKNAPETIKSRFDLVNMLSVRTGLRSVLTVVSSQSQPHQTYAYIDA